VCRFNSGVFDISVNTMRTDPLRRRPLELVHIPPSYAQVKSLLKAIKLSKRCSGNHIILGRFCDNPNHRSWQELYPCPLCKIPLGSQTKQLISGELAHKICGPFSLTNDGIGDGNCENDEKQQLDTRLLPGSGTLNHPRRRPPEVPRPKPKRSGVRNFISDLLYDNST
jgi:hypothetical protein